MDFLKCESHKNTQNFMETLLNSGLLPLITRPTRITKDTATLIDNILTSRDLYSQSQSAIIIKDLSDHLPCIAIFKNQKSLKGETITITKRDLKPSKLDLVRNDVTRIDWKKKLMDKPPSSQFETLHNTILESLDTHCPEKERIISEKHHIREPWITKGIMNCIRKQKLLYKNLLKIKDEASDQSYKRYRNTLQKIMRYVKRVYYINACTQFKNNTKKLWSIINEVTRKTRNKSDLIEKITVENVDKFQSKEISNEFANYFSKIGKSYADKIPASNKSIDWYLEKIPRNSRSVFLKPCNETEIKNIINKLPNKKSSGFDGVSNVLLKSISSCLLQPLVIIFNNSLATGEFPTLMKHAEVVPLFKSGLRNFMNNYRPISLLLTLSKLLEKIVYVRVYDFLDVDQIYSSQYGFRSKHSCENAITELISVITKGWERNKSTLVVYLDLSKAFDTLEHSVLFDKLDRYGIRGQALDWFRSYLSGRSMSVKCQTSSSGKGVTSDQFSVEYGSPQGSCLGPLLFLIFCNDLHRTLELCSCILFADDTTLYYTHDNQSYLEWCINHDLLLLSDWFRANKLTLNLNKTVCMYFTKNKVKHCLGKLKIKCNDIDIPVVTSAKFLGVWIDDKLSWNAHCTKLILKLNKNINILQISKNFLDTHTLKTLYYAQIYSNITYGIGLWGNHVNADQLKKLQNIQNKCVALIKKQKFARKIDFETLEILNIKQIIKLENMKFGYKLEKKLLPAKIADCVLHDHDGKSLSRSHKYGTRNKNRPYTPKTRTKHYINSILCRSIQEFQTLKGETKSKLTLHSFVIACKKEITSWKT